MAASSLKLAACAALLLFGACDDEPAAAPPATAPAAAAPPASAPAAPPVGDKRTTAGPLAVANLESQIAAAEKLAAARDSPELALRVASLLSMRGQFLGRVADRERATALVSALAEKHPRDPGVLLARAGTHAQWHRFDAALADLDAAAAAGANPTEVEAARASIWEAQGRLEEALPVRIKAAEAWPNIETLGALAALRGDLGELEAAHELFGRALASYRDVSPFPVAFIEVQEGLMWMRAGRLPEARALFERALQRLPAYAQAAGELAEVEVESGNPAKALALFEPLLTASDDPEYPGHLVPLLTAAGRPDEAAAALARGKAAFDAAIARHPEAFADHAASFWLEVGGDPKKAHDLATLNLKLRRTPAAYALAIETALAVGDPAGACKTADEAQASPRRSPDLTAALARARAACP